MNAFKKLKFSKDGIGAVLLKIDSDDVTVVVDKVRRRPCLAANTAVSCSGESRGATKLSRVRAGDARRLAGRRGGRAGRCEPTVSPPARSARYPRRHGPHGIPLEPLRTEWRS